MRHYVIKDKLLRIMQNLLDDMKANPDKKKELYEEAYQQISKEDISDLQLKETVEKIVFEMQDMSYNDIFSEIQKMRNNQI